MPRAALPPASRNRSCASHRVRDVEPHPPMSSLRPAVRRSPSTALLRRASAARRRWGRCPDDLHRPRLLPAVRSELSGSDFPRLESTCGSTRPTWPPRQRHVAPRKRCVSKDWVNQSSPGQPLRFCRKPPQLLGNKPAVHPCSKIIRNRSCFQQINPWRR